MKKTRKAAAFLASAVLALTGSAASLPMSAAELSTAVAVDDGNDDWQINYKYSQ